MFKKLALLLFILIAKLSNSTAQVDSIEQILSTTKIDTVKLKAYSDLNWLLLRSNSAKAKQYAFDELLLAQKINNRKYIAQGYNDIGISLIAESNFKESLKYHNLALVIRLSLGNQKDIASSYSKIGYCYSEMDQFKNALDVQLKALFIYRQLKENKNTTYTLNNICYLYSGLKNYDKVVEFASQAYKLAVAENDSFSIANALHNLSTSYEKKNDFNEAINNEKKALQIFSLLNDSIQVGATLNNLGYYYRQLYRDEIALDYYLQALKIAELTHDKNSIGLYHNNVGNVYLTNKDYTHALYHLKLAEKICTEQDMKSTLLLVYKSFGDVYALTGKGTLAVENYNKYTTIKDSIFSLDMVEQFSTLQTKYEIKEKEATNLLLQKENELTQAELAKSNIIKWSLVITLLLCIPLVYLFYNSFKLKQQRLLDSQLHKQQEENAKAIIEAEENERTRIARDLHDGIGQQLSAAKLNLSGLKSVLEPTANFNKDMLDNAIELVDESIHEIRTVSHNMMLDSLVKIGLVTAVKNFINKLNNTDKIKINIETFGIHQRLDNVVETVVFRILQELMNNIIKHANATEVSIQIIKHDNELSLLIDDNGNGFDTAKMGSFEGIGLKNILTRVNYINGKVFFDSFVGRGTTVTVEIPLNT
ncbi:MAG: sensor histidine kinase [Bacteroidota bacterium]